MSASEPSRSPRVSGEDAMSELRAEPRAEGGEPLLALEERAERAEGTRSREDAEAEEEEEEDEEAKAGEEGGEPEQNCW